jgi:hypothetical protein
MAQIGYRMFPANVIVKAICPVHYENRHYDSFSGCPGYQKEMTLATKVIRKPITLSDISTSVIISAACERFNPESSQKIFLFNEISSLRCGHQ